MTRRDPAALHADRFPGVHIETAGGILQDEEYYKNTVILDGVQAARGTSANLVILAIADYLSLLNETTVVATIYVRQDDDTYALIFPQKHPAQSMPRPGDTFALSDLGLVINETPGCLTSAADDITCETLSCTSRREHAWRFVRVGRSEYILKMLLEDSSRSSIRVVDPFDPSPLVDSKPLVMAMINACDAAREKARDAIRRIPDPKTPSLRHVSIQGWEKDAYLKRFIDRYNTLFADGLSDQPHDRSPMWLSARSGTGGTTTLVLNLFSIVRFKQGGEFSRANTDYTSQLILYDRQEKACADLGLSMSDLYKPLDGSEATPSDHTFQTGTITFSSVKALEHDTQPRTRTLFKLIDSVVPPAQRENWGLMLVPVHVSGVPWLSLVTLTRMDSFDDWRHRYWFYREIAMGYAKRIRRTVSSAYIECLTTIFEEHLHGSIKRGGDLDETLAEINDAWLKVGLVYPYRVPQVCRSAATETEQADTYELSEAFAPSGDKLVLVQADRRRLFGAQLEHDRLDVEQLGRECDLIVRNLNATHESVLHQNRLIYDVVAHTSINTLRAGAADVALEDVAWVDPPELRVQVHAKRNGEFRRDVCLEQALLGSLLRLWVSETATIGALALPRLIATDGVVVSTLAASTPYSLEEAVSIARQLVGGYRTAQKDVAEPRFTIGDELERVMFPEGYLQKEIVASIIYELLHNTVRHAGQSIVDVRINASAAVPTGITLKVSNTIQAQGGLGWSGKNVVTRGERGPRHYLKLLETVGGLLDGAIDVRTSPEQRDGQWWYVATLKLSALRTHDNLTVSPTIHDSEVAHEP